MKLTQSTVLFYSEERKSKAGPDTSAVDLTHLTHLTTSSTKNFQLCCKTSRASNSSGGFCVRFFFENSTIWDSVLPYDIFVYHFPCSADHKQDSSRVPRRSPFIYFNRHRPSGQSPSLSGHAVAYRWSSLPRLRRYRASIPQGSSRRVVPCGRSPWTSSYAPLFPTSTHYWYEVGMLKVPAALYNVMTIITVLGNILLVICTRLACQ